MLGARRRRHGSPWALAWELHRCSLPTNEELKVWELEQPTHLALGPPCPTGCHQTRLCGPLCPSQCFSLFHEKTLYYFILTGQGGKQGFELSEELLLQRFTRSSKLVHEVNKSALIAPFYKRGK